MPAQSYGGDKEGVLPWNREAIEKAGAEMPTILSESEEPPYEEFIAAKPDVILAHYSGITEEQYDKLAAIAPTVAYPEEAWATPWRDVITTTGEVLGKERGGRAVWPTSTSRWPRPPRRTPSSRARRSPRSATGASTSTRLPTRGWEILADLGLRERPERRPSWTAGSPRSSSR